MSNLSPNYITLTRNAPESHPEAQPVITVFGDGQLARMMQPAAAELGQSLRLLASDRTQSAAQVIPDTIVGDYHEMDALVSAAEGSAAITFDHEHVPTEHLLALQKAGYSVQPPPQALLYAQDKLEMRKKLRELGAPVPLFMGVDATTDLDALWAAFSGEVCLKTCRGGYDGHGVWFPSTPDELRELVSSILNSGSALMAERKVALRRELSAMIARRPSGETKLWPVVESVQKDGICAVAIAPAPGISVELARKAQALAERIATELGVTGVLAVELFEVLDEDGEPTIVVNELAMRPHNTGHWTQNGSATSQFEQHLRAVLDLPLGATDPTTAVTVMANVLGGNEPTPPWDERMAAVWRRFPEAKIHFYGKGFRAGRKLGHVNISDGFLTSEDAKLSSDPALAADVRRRAELAAHYLAYNEWADGYVE